METQVRTPQMVFMQPQRLVVPLFQRPYVWNEEIQWEPLWNDIVRVTDRVIVRPAEKHHPHFLGAVVLQQVQKKTGQMQERTIIDGQQRLTTLQLLLDALHAELLSVKALQPAMRIEPLVTNAEPFCSKPEDRFKVWPTNRDRPAFNAIMGAKPPIDYSAVGYHGELMVRAHLFFSEQAREWLLLEGAEAAERRGAAIETVVRELLHMVVIDLAADENAQEIFETLNARGTPLTPADLIKNFVFQRLLETTTNVEDAYQKHWKEFETGFWETEISVGRLRSRRSSIFLNHWLISRTGEEVVAREVFARFKTFAGDQAGLPMAKVLEQVHAAAGVYRDFTIASTQIGPIDRLGLFGYRTGVLESEVIKPLVLCLLDPEFLHAGSPEPATLLVAAFRQGLSESGYVEGRNVTISSAAAMTHDLETGEIDAGILWGPMAGYFARQSSPAMTVVPLVKETGGPRLVYRIAMGVRFADQDWKRLLNRTIQENQPAINRILLSFGVPLLDDRDRPITEGATAK